MQCKIDLLESTLEFTKEKIGLEHVLVQLLGNLADATVAKQTDENQVDRLVAKSEALLAAMKDEISSVRQIKGHLISLVDLIAAPPPPDGSPDEQPE
jgi:hypothetical protein